MDDSKEQLKNQVRSIADAISEPGTVEANDEYDEEHELSASEWMQDVLDIQYIISSRGEYLGARILVAFGGPNIWVDTRAKTVEGHWWGDYAEWSFTDNLGLDDYCEELWACVR